MEIANDGGLKTTFETTTLPVFWIKVMGEYPEIVTTALKPLLPFPTSYLYEAEFSAVTATKTKQRSKVDISNTLRVSLSPITPPPRDCTHTKVLMLRQYNWPTSRNLDVRDLDLTTRDTEDRPHHLQHIMITLTA
ncbi:hypothetical protein FHG87_021837 [Trinorchestia longiramus]|nr:hypothetical protein FHG87_021837 [Trinorchestia longiramus]